MEALINVFIALVALLHFWFLILEMFLWQKPIGLKTFHLSVDFAKASAPLAANQGLYNGFLSAGLIWSLFASNATLAIQLQVFFLSCVMVAGIYGAISVNKRILFIQALPAVVTLILIIVSL
jgi:putative membrane protein